MEKIAERIRKLLALANNNPSEVEAARAMEHASALMAEHNLTMAQIDAHGSGDARVEETTAGAYRQQTWARLIYGGVSGLNFCLYCYSPSQRQPGWRKDERGKYHRDVPPREVDEHSIIGTRANVETTKAMVDYLITTVERLARESGLIGQRDLHAFKLGCASRLRDRIDRLHEERAKAKKHTQPSVASALPVLADVYAVHLKANEEFYTKIYGGALSGRGSALGTKSASAYERGQSAGGKINLSDQIGRASVRALPGR
jgi:hypothetical protein